MINQMWRLKSLGRRIFESLGSKRYSMPAYNQIDQRLSNLLSENGYFVEAGAVDGFFESNTYYLERFRGWTGVLVEPIPEMFNRLRVNRPKSKAFNCALVPFGYGEDEVSIRPAHALSSISSDTNLGSASISVPARTLSSILDEARLPRVDLLSLDVEGYEIEVLRGICFERHAPRFILIEALDVDLKMRIDGFLFPDYEEVGSLSYRDFLYQRVRT
jgi:FkbM family methyltransferase